MHIGYMAIGVGLLADGETIGMTAQRAEQAGFHSIWAPEHIVLLDQYSSQYPVIVWPFSADLQAVKDNIDKLGDEVVAPAANL